MLAVKPVIKLVKIPEPVLYALLLSAIVEFGAVLQQTNINTEDTAGFITYPPLVAVVAVIEDTTALVTIGSEFNRQRIE